MIDAKALLERFLGQPGQPQPGAPPAATPRGASGGMPLDLGEAARRALGGLGGPGGAGGAGGLAGYAGAAAAGGLLALVLGKKGRKGGGVLSHGGAALLGALAHRAVQNWQAGRAPAAAPVAGPADAAAVDARFLPEAAPAADGGPFELALIRAMVGAARADGHIDATERARIFDQVEKAGLDAEAKAFVFDALEAETGVREVAAAARTQEQAAELYLVSRLTIEPDQPAERAYLAALAHRLNLPADLVAHLDRQAEAALRDEAG